VIGSSCRSSSCRCVVVDLLDACSLVLGYVLPHDVDVRCCAEPAVGLLYSLRCDIVVLSLLFT
jgi:hypothetical protein